MTRDRTQTILKAVAGLGLASAVGFGGLAAYEAFGTDAPAQAHASTILDTLVSPESEDSAQKAAESTQGDDSAVTAAPEPFSLLEGVPAPSEAATGEAFAVINHGLFGGPQPIVKSDPASPQETQRLVDSGVVVAYESRENPGEKGNFAVIGHRNSHGAVFKRAPELRMGDSLTVTTSEGTFTYEVIKQAYRTASDDHSILDSNPFGDEVNDSRALMSLITCGTWLTDHREVVVLELVEDSTDND